MHVDIQKVSIIGLGALGVLFGQRLMENGAELKIVANQQRIERYTRDGVFSNGKRCAFDYVSTTKTGDTDDLVMFAVKYHDLPQAIVDVRNRVGPNTILLSMLNGISSERDIANAYGWDNIVCAVAQGMDALKEQNRLRYMNIGQLAIGSCETGPVPETVRAVARYFNRMNVPHEVVQNMPKRMWGKWMTNVGVNQTIGAFGGTFSNIQREGELRETMVAAMREVIALSQADGVDLDEADLQYWLSILDTLDPTGKPSLRQDIEAKRKTEVELFAGTVQAMGERWGIRTPVNRDLFMRIKELEDQYGV